MNVNLHNELVSEEDQNFNPSGAIKAVVIGSIFAAISGGIYHLFSETLSRRKIGPIVDSCKNDYHLDPRDSELLTGGPFSNAIKKKAEALLTESKDEQEVEEYQSLLKLMSKSNPSRFDLTMKEWAAYDRVAFSLTSDRLKSLQKSLNSGEYDNISQKMKDQFCIDFKEALISEVLARSLAYSLGHDGKTIQIPVLNEKGTCSLVDYKITSFKFGDNLPAYILESEEEKGRPWIIARGTEAVVAKDEKGVEYRPGGLESIFVDFIDGSGIAREVVSKACVTKQNGMDLRDHFDKWAKAGTQVNLAGHSLGGYLMHDLAIRFYDQIGHAYGFCAPAVDSTQGKLWHAIVENEDSKERQKIVNFITENDFVPSAGTELIGTNISISPSHNTSDNTPFKNHGKFVLPGNFKAQAIDPKSESKKWARTVANKVRYLAGNILKAALPKLGNPYVPEWWEHRQNYQFV